MKPRKASALTSSQAVDASRFQKAFGLRLDRDVESKVLECGSSHA